MNLYAGGGGGGGGQQSECTWWLIRLMAGWQTVHDKWKIQIIGIFCVCFILQKSFNFFYIIELDLSGHKLNTYSH